MYYAHMTKDGRKQTVKEHNRKVADIAASKLKPIRLASVGKLCGLLHDGKATNAFQKYLKDSADGKSVKRGSVVHTYQGVKYVMDQWHKCDANQILTAEIIACAIGSHHGLFDTYNEFGENGFNRRRDYESMEYEKVKNSFEHDISSQEELNFLFVSSCIEISQIVSKIKKVADSQEECFFMLSLLIRLISSVLMYADRTDTDNFYHGESGKGEEDFEADLLYMEEKLRGFKKQKTEIDRVRKEISDQCYAFGKNPTDIYLMDIPTGGGKTLSSLRYGLRHASLFGKNRIIFTAPLLSIIDQNAQVVRDFLPPNADYLEFHSDVSNRADDMTYDRWDAQIIYTTQFQILSILFDGKTNYITRMQSLIDSVLIFDEVQSIPRKCVKMFAGAIKFLKEICHTTVILSSATQPDYQTLDFPIQGKKMVHLTDAQAKVFCRNRIQVLGEMDETQIASFVRKQLDTKNSFLVVCNTKREVQTLCEDLKDFNPMILWSNECKSHRKDLIAEIKKKLSNGEKILVISTQIVEAGVDLSFEAGIRILAGIDNVVQTAGRLSRNGEFPSATLYVIPWKQENLVYLKDIEDAKLAARQALCLYGDIESQKTANEFYRQYYSDRNLLRYPTKIQGKTRYLTDLLSNSLARECMENIVCVPYKEVGEHFKVFPEDGVDVIVPYKRGKELIKEIENASSTESLRPLLREASPYVVKIYDSKLKKFLKEGSIKSILDTIFVLDESSYGKFGIEI